MASDSFKYGMPLLCCAWLNDKAFLLGGGGGRAATGIKNRVVLAKHEAGIMSDQQAELDFGKSVPIRCARHPNGEDLIVGCAGRGAKHLRVSATPIVLEDRTDSPIHDAFATIDQEISCAIFAAEGRFLVCAFSGGWIQIWKWPEMHIKFTLRQEATYRELKDLDVSTEKDPELIVVTTGKGSAELWSFRQGDLLGEIDKTGLKGERFAHCRFCISKGKCFLYTTMMRRKSSHLVKFKVASDKKVVLQRQIKTGKDPISAFAISQTSLAIGTSEGCIQLFTPGQMLPLMRVDGAHMVFVSAIRFAPATENEEGESRLLSISGDSSARVIAVRSKSEIGIWLKTRLPFLLLNLILVLVGVWLLLYGDSKDEL